MVNRTAPPGIAGLRLHVTPKKCIGCRTCELACAFSHCKTLVQPSKSRIFVHSCGEEVYMPMVCLQCDDAACAKVCPVEALVRNENTGAVEVIDEKCVRCMACVAACPFGNMHLDQARMQVIKCDLCGGDPLCAKFCPTQTLEYKP